MKLLAQAVPLLAMVMALGACVTSAPRTADTRIADDGEPASSAAAWSRLDSDGDGALSRDELEQQHAVGLQEDLHNADGDADGRVSHEEFDAWWPRMTRVPEPASMARLNASSSR